MKLLSLGEKVDPKAKMNGIKNKQKDTGRWRDLTAYWILGLCTNFG